MTYAARIAALPTPIPVKASELTGGCLVNLPADVREVRAIAAAIAAKADAELSKMRERVAELERDAEIVAQVRTLLWDDCLECCGRPVVGGEYMGQQEQVCCGQPEYVMLNDAQIVASLRALLPDAALNKESA